LAVGRGTVEKGDASGVANALEDGALRPSLVEDGFPDAVGAAAVGFRDAPVPQAPDPNRATPKASANGTRSAPAKPFRLQKSVGM
jgi:hypothetical protein